MLESFQVLGVSSLGVWLGDREGETGRGINELGSRDKEFGSPSAIAPLVGEDLVVSVDELVEST